MSPHKSTLAELFREGDDPAAYLAAIEPVELIVSGNLNIMCLETGTEIVIRLKGNPNVEHRFEVDNIESLELIGNDYEQKTGQKVNRRSRKTRKAYLTTGGANLSSRGKRDDSDTE